MALLSFRSSLPALSSLFLRSSSSSSTADLCSSPENTKNRVSLRDFCWGSAVPGTTSSKRFPRKTLEKVKRMRAVSLFEMISQFFICIWKNNFYFVFCKPISIFELPGKEKAQMSSKETISLKCANLEESLEMLQYSTQQLQWELEELYKLADAKPTQRARRTRRTRRTQQSNGIKKDPSKRNVLCRTSQRGEVSCEITISQ